jgi:hypothetical protein
MTDWLNDALKTLRERWERGQHEDDAIQATVAELSTLILLDAEERLNRRFKQRLKDEWAEPAPRENLNQLRFNLGDIEIAVADTPVRVVHPDGHEELKPASRSTGAEREDSIAARIQHHVSHVRRAEGEHRREVEQNHAAEALGLRIRDVAFDDLRHQATGTKCWRCGLGWRAGDPFERGHSDRPASQGGVVVEWEHRSCNRSCRDNPVARPLES